MGAPWDMARARTKCNIPMHLKPACERCSPQLTPPRLSYAFDRKEAAERSNHPAVKRLGDLGHLHSQRSCLLHGAM